jgi:chromosome partitioning protein
MILLVDCDPPLTTADWLQERNDNPERHQIKGVQLNGNIRNDLLSLKKRYDYVIVDCGGEGNRAQRSTMVVATDARSHHHLQDGQFPPQDRRGSGAR